MTAKEIAKLATYMADTGATVRQAAKVFNISKSTVHKNVTRDLKDVDSVLYRQVEEVLKNNKAERHVRGGMATRDKYLKLKEN